MENIPELVTISLIKELQVSKGMKVLDVGCGRGDLSNRLLEIVGSTGSVIGVDIDKLNIEHAQENAKKEKKRNLKFICADIDSSMQFQEQFDVIFGRRVLVYLKDPKQTISDLTKFLRTNGKIGFQEHDSSATSKSSTPMPLHDKVNNWVWETIIKEGGTKTIGGQLWNIFDHADLTIQDIRSEQVIQTPKSPLPIAQLIKIMENRITSNGIATKEEIGIDTLEEKLTEERMEANTIYIREAVFRIIATKTK